MRTIHVVTHPEATHHVEGRVGGWYDSDLTAVGKRDAAAVIADALYSHVPHAAAIEVIADQPTRPPWLGFNAHRRFLSNSRSPRATR